MGASALTVVSSFFGGGVGPLVAGLGGTTATLSGAVGDATDGPSLMAGAGSAAGAGGLTGVAGDSAGDGPVSVGFVDAALPVVD
jgi:hypothetical protein